MSNVVAMSRTTDQLTQLADAINACLTKADDYRVRTAIHLAEAQDICRAQGITFKDWVAANIKLGYHESVRLAGAGHKPDVAQAIADMRERSRSSMEESRVAQRGATPRAIELIEDEDAEVEPAPGELPDSMRVRGFLHRAKEAAEMAMADDMAGIKVTVTMRLAASNAAEAWIKLLANLEGE
jgi:hypothetical protein